MRRTILGRTVIAGASRRLRGDPLFGLTCCRLVAGWSFHLCLGRFTLAFMWYRP